MSLQNYTFRFIEISKTAEDTDTEYRSEYSRDYARVIHSPSFRRLQNKTQLFPGQESDFFRNRLTHSLEVAQIAKSIAHKLKKEYDNLDISPDVCEIAGLIHDIGHPPFGHNGEAALDNCMLTSGGFEGNAQTLRVITRLEKKERPESLVDDEQKDCRVGLNLTARVILSALKYDKKIPISREKPKLIKGYYDTECDIINCVKKQVIGNYCGGKIKTVDCAVMDIADDIAYSTYDLEDALKANFLTPYDIMAADDSILEQIVEKLAKDGIKVTTADCRIELAGLFADVWDREVSNISELRPNDDNYEEKALSNILASYQNSKRLAQDGYLRSRLTSKLVNTFINGISVEINSDCSILSKIKVDSHLLLRINILKHFAYVCLINSSRLKVSECRGGEIIKKMFEKLHSGGKDGGAMLLPEDTRLTYLSYTEDVPRARVICDFIAGMTDRYALEFYGRLFSENPQTIFKPF